MGTGVIGALASRWRVTGILNARSGNRLNVTTGIDNAFTGQRDQRPNRISDDVYPNERTLTNYFNRAAFAQPEPGTYGNVKRNALVGPHFWNVDLAVSRQINVASAQALELRLETFNLFNTFNWGDPGMDQAAGGTHRQYQLGRVRPHHHAGRLAAYHPARGEVHVLSAARGPAEAGHYVRRT